MRRTFLMSTVAAASLALLVACSKTENQAPAPAPSPSPSAENSTPDTTGTATAPSANNETASAIQDDVSGAAGSVDAATTTSTDGFVKAAAISDMYEVQAAKIALQRSQRDEVKSFAQKMIDAHTATTHKLEALLSSGKVNATAPTALDDRHKGWIDNLNGAADADFDARYLDQQRMAHNEASTLFKNYVDHGDNADLKQFASVTLPAINQHLQMARDLDHSNSQGSTPTQ